MRLSRMILFVNDVDDVAGFYERHFGMARIGEEDGWIELDGGGCGLALHAKKGANGKGSNAKICFAVADVAAERARLEAEGLEFHYAFEWQGMNFADTRDPAGNAVQISDRGVK
jgi:catechol 2,3-dioxygenase-like lactoylglutathione lyase family enzyme